MPLFSLASGPFTAEREIAAPYEVVLKLIQDPKYLASESPLFMSIVNKSETEPDLYTITESIPIFGGYLSTSTVFESKIQPVEDGVTVDVNAALWRKLHSRYSVERRTSGSCVLKEVTNIECLSILFTHTFNTTSGAHIAVLDKTVQKFAGTSEDH